MRAISNRDPERAAARAAAVRRAVAEGIIRRRPRRLGGGLFREEGRMETQEEANARAEREEADEARRVGRWEAWQNNLRQQYQRTPEEEEAYHLAEAERYRNAPPGSAFGGSNETMEQYHRNQAAIAAARRAAAANPFGSPNPFGAP